MHEQNEKLNKEIETIRKPKTKILELKNIMTELKNPTEFWKLTFSVFQKSQDLKTGNLILSSQGSKKKKEQKWLKKAHRNYRIPSKETISTLGTSQEKRKVSVFKAIMAETSQSWRTKWTSRFTRPKGSHPT